MNGKIFLIIGGVILAVVAAVSIAPIAKRLAAIVKAADVMASPIQVRSIIRHPNYRNTIFLGKAECWMSVSASREVRMII